MTPDLSMRLFVPQHCDVMGQKNTVLQEYTLYFVDKLLHKD